MHTPTRAQFQKVIDLLYTILPLTFEQECSLNMAVTRVNYNHVCGTVHCFGGWIAVALIEADKLTGEVWYDDGANVMARMLGFERAEYLQDWAEINKDIWGNRRGYSMFCEEKAFRHSILRPKGAKSVSDIINHLEEVQARLPK